MIEFGQDTGAVGILFQNPETEQEFAVQVRDKYPQMGDVHVEGRRVVEVSVEMFIELVSLSGFTVVPPKTEGDSDE